MNLGPICAGVVLVGFAACTSFDLESRRFRCVGQPEICEAGWVCGSDGYCTHASAADDASTVEICDNALDDDADGRIDCADTECPGTNTCGPGCYCISGQPRELACTDAEDNDRDTAVDCRDPDCPSCFGQTTCCPDGACRSSC